MKKQKRKINRESDDLKSLGSELGSFGLEPPQIYRPEQRSKIQSDAKKKARSVKHTVSKKKKQPLTRAEQAKNRQKMKKLRRALTIVGIIVSVVIVVIILCLTVFFKIDTIKVVGNENYTKKEIIAVLPIEKQKNMFLADTDSAIEKLEKNLPYIYSAEIKRKIPSTIVVTVTETPRYYSYLNPDNTYILLDDNFKVLETAATQAPIEAIELSKFKINDAVAGEQLQFASKKKAKTLLAMSDCVKAMSLDEITAMYSVDVNNNYFVYDNRITIKVGAVDNLENKMYLALAAIEKLQESSPDVVGEISATGGKQVYFTETK